jgi:hypothetical protein
VDFVMKKNAKFSAKNIPQSISSEKNPRRWEKEGNIKNYVGVCTLGFPMLRAISLHESQAGIHQVVCGNARDGIYAEKLSLGDNKVGWKEVEMENIEIQHKVTNTRESGGN